MFLALIQMGYQSLQNIVLYISQFDLHNLFQFYKFFIADSQVW